MRDSAKAVIKALKDNRMTSASLARETDYSQSAVKYALAVLIATGQAVMIGPGFVVPVYCLTGPICECCGQVKR